MRKNVAIFGPSRSGKSTLARMICRELGGYHLLGGDEVRDAFIDVMPELGIDNWNGPGMHGLFQRFIYKMFHHHIRQSNYCERYVIETCDMTPEQAADLFCKRKDTIVLFLGYPSITPDDKLAQLREYEMETDWTRPCTDEHMLAHVRKNAAESKEDQDRCEKLGIWFVDTSFDRDEVLADVMREIKRQTSGEWPEGIESGVLEDKWDQAESEEADVAERSDTAEGTAKGCKR